MQHCCVSARPHPPIIEAVDGCCATHGGTRPSRARLMAARQLRAHLHSGQPWYLHASVHFANGFADCEVRLPIYEVVDDLFGAF